MEWVCIYQIIQLFMHGNTMSCNTFVANGHTVQCMLFQLFGLTVVFPVSCYANILLNVFIICYLHVCATILFLPTCSYRGGPAISAWLSEWITRVDHNFGTVLRLLLHLTCCLLPDGQMFIFTTQPGWIWICPTEM